MATTRTHDDATVFIGIDPGYERCGFAVLSKDCSLHETLLYSDCFVTAASLPFEERLTRIGRELTRLIDVFTPDVVALEKLYFTTNQKTAMRVSEVRGMLLYLAHTHGCLVCEYGPNEIKVAVAGDGRGAKRQVMAMVPKLVRIEKKVKYDDEYDAIAVALTASASYRAGTRTSTD